MNELAKRIVTGQSFERIYLNVVPGGGKSLIPLICASRLVPSIADRICWVVPRKSLQTQGAQNFTEPDKWDLLGTERRTIRESTNDHDPCRGHHGYITTYQALLMDDKGTNEKEFRRQRYILILDEPHHVAEGSPYHVALLPLMKHAVLVVLMSGTFERHDGVRIAFTPYVRDGSGWRLDMPKTSDEMGPYAFIRYNRAEALHEKAIKPLHFTRIDGAAEWIAVDGKEKRQESLSTGGVDASDALYTALRTDYAHQLLDRSVSDWQAYRTQRSFAKLLVIAPGIAEARDYLKHLKALGVPRVEIATSDDSASAEASIERFKRRTSDPGALDVLVTVAMAYEGLDVPEITHLALLTHIRSVPWILQALQRAGRMVNPHSCKLSYEEQVGYIYGPDDPILTGIIDAILVEQEPFISDQRYTPRGPRPTDIDWPPEETQRIRPVASVTTRERSIDMTTGDVLNYEESARMLHALRKHGLGGLLDPITFKRVLDDYNAGSEDYADRATVTVEQTPRQRETRLRREINQAIQAFEGRNKIEWGTVNAKAKAVFKKSRDEMTEHELEQVWQWLQTLTVA